MASPTKTNPYSALIGNSGTLHFAGIDQGIDFTGQGPLYALAPGTITREQTSGSGWPGQGALIVEQLTGGPAKGKSVYYAEDLSPAAGIAVGSVVGQGTQLATATGSGLAPGVEVGWAQASGSPVAPLPPPRPASQFTPEGQSFLAFVGTGGGVNTGFNTIAGLPGAHGSPLGGIPFGGQIQSGVNAVAAPFKDAASFFAWIGNAKNLQRVGEMLAGGVLIALGVVMVGRAATSSSPAQQTRGAVRTVTRTRAARSGPARRPVTPRAPTRRESRRVSDARFKSSSRLTDEGVPY